MEISTPIFTGICIFVLLFSYFYQEKNKYLLHINPYRKFIEDEYYA